MGLKELKARPGTSISGLQQNIHPILTQDTKMGEKVISYSSRTSKRKGPPQKYPYYVMESETLYRNISHRAGSEDDVAWKMCIHKSLRETVLRENHGAL